MDMTDLSVEQAALRASIHKSGLIWGGIAGLVVGGLAYWLAGSLDMLPRAAIAVIAAGGVGFVSYRGIFGSGSKQAQCEKCGTPFSVRESGRSERLVSSMPKSKVEEAQPAEAVDKTKAKLSAAPAKPGKVMTKWIEDSYEVTVTSTCAHCKNESSRILTETRERDKQTITK
jgi:hypothetical protein